MGAKQVWCCIRVGHYFAKDLFRQAVNIYVYFICCVGKRKSLGIVGVGFDDMGQLLIIYFGFVRYLKGGEGNTMEQCIELKEAYDSV